MPQFDPTVLRIDTTRERWELAGDVIGFTELVLRWPYHAIINIAYELHPDIYAEIDESNPPLMLYLCDEVLIGQEEQKTLRLRPIHINTPFDPFLPNISNIVVLRRVVERLEKQHPNYAAIRHLKDEENSLLLAMPDNLKEIVIYILRAWQQALNRKQKIKDGDYSLKSNFWTEILVPVDGLPPLIPEPFAPPFAPTTKEVTLLALAPPDLAVQTTENIAQSKEEKIKESVREFIRVKQLRLTKDTERLVALEALFDAGFPRLKNEHIGEILWPDLHHVDPKTLKSYGSRICSNLRKLKGKIWEKNLST